VVLFGSVLGAEMLWSMVEELGFLAFEWTEKTMDLMFEEVFEFAPESAQKATAWTGFSLLILLTAWGGFTLYRKFLILPKWWSEKKEEIMVWWSGLPWTLKLVNIFVYLFLVFVLAMLI